jgi:hypothetical protein
VLEEHLNEACFLWTQWERALTTVAHAGATVLQWAHPIHRSSTLGFRCAKPP